MPKKAAQKTTEQFQAPTRVHYFPGQLLTADDFQADQEYHRNKRRLFNRYLVGSGIVTGLSASISATGQQGIIISPGFAIDPLGNEIVVPETQTIALPTSEQAVYLFLSYGEQFICPASNNFTRVLETFALNWSAEPSSDNAVPLWHLLFTRKGWRINPRYRPKRVKL